MTVCIGCDTPSGSTVLCESCVVRVLAGLKRMRAALRRVGSGSAQPALTVQADHRRLLLQLWTLQVGRYTQLIPVVLLLGVHVWFWQYLFRISCVQRAGLVMTLSLLAGTLIGLVIGARQGGRSGRSQLRRFMTVPENTSTADILARSVREQLRERLPTLLWAIMGIGLILALFQMAMWRLPRWFSDAMVLAAFLVMQLLLSLTAALFYGVFRGLSWVSVCVQYVRRRIA